MPKAKAQPEPAANSRLAITYKPLADIKPYAKNPRRNDDAVGPVAESIKRFGFKVPIIIDADGTIVAGHTRYKAALKLGLTEVPTVSAADLTPAQVKAFRIADNKVSDFSLWDNVKLLQELDSLKFDDVFTGFDNFGFDENIASNQGQFGSESQQNGGMEPLNEAQDFVPETNGNEFFEAIFRSTFKEKIEKIKEAWEELGKNPEWQES